MMKDTDTMLFSAEDIKSGGSSPIFKVLDSINTCKGLVTTIKEFLSCNSIEELKPLEEVIISPLEIMGKKWQDNGYSPTPAFKISDVNSVTSKW